ncbi:MAG: TIGR00282 family metallophosphoesterase [Candidatus Hydrothermae bacterium]|nr:TIGR00282 family metallophosphoesterase [Candidatus Hydrothermae bacterium]
MITVLFIGDVVAGMGREVVRKLLPGLRNKYDVDFAIANGENIAGGIGLTEKTAEEMKAAGVDVLTGGNHMWDKREVYQFIDNVDWIVRPLNYPPGTPGKGFGYYRIQGCSVMVFNLLGRVFMNGYDCPFRTAEEFLKGYSADIIILDFHAEATSEKVSLGYFLDGKVSLIVGTHTHVQTSDARVLPGGTGYVTDAGMTGGLGGVIGVKKELFVKRFITQMPVAFEPEEKDPGLEGVLARIDSNTGKCVDIKLLREYL